MSHDRGCHCGREKWEYDDCPQPNCHKKERLVPKLETTLKARSGSYGPFKDNATVAQAIKNSMRAHEGWEGLPATMKEGLDLIALKMSRIVTGDWRHIDNPHDIAGYAKCMEEFLLGDK